MSDDTNTSAPRVGGSVLMSYKELSQLNERITRIDTKLDVALSLPAKIQDHEERLVSLETERAVQSAKGGVYGKAWDTVIAVILAFIAAGVWLPKLH